MRHVHLRNDGVDELIHSNLAAEEKEIGPQAQCTSPSGAHTIHALLGSSMYYYPRYEIHPTATRRSQPVCFITTTFFIAFITLYPALFIQSFLPEIEINLPGFVAVNQHPPCFLRFTSLKKTTVGLAPFT
jgi:hypothetical protein